MAAGAPERYRSPDALRDAAVYVDGQGHILAGNDAFQELWILSGAGRGRFQGSTLLQIFVENDRTWVRDTLGSFEALARSSSCVPRLAGSLASTTTEFKPIRRRSRAGTLGIVVEGTEVHLRRVVANLVGNALKFTSPGGTVECRLWRSAGWAGIVVSDSGRGIDRELLPRVFDAFRQAALRAPDQEGLGLGLTVVRHLVELHGGTVTAASAGCGCGSTFTVLLPAVSRLAAGEVVPRTSVGVSTDGPHAEGRASALNTTNVQLSHCAQTR